MTIRNPANHARSPALDVLLLSLALLVSAGGFLVHQISWLVAAL